MATFSGSPTASADDGYVDDNGGTIDNSATAVQVRGFDFIFETGALIGYVRVPGVTIPQGATINSATLTVIASANFAPTTQTVVTAFDEDDSDQIADATDYYGRSLTTANTDDVFNGAFFAGDPEEVDVTAIVQEIVDRVGWVSGNAMQFVFQQNSGSGIVAAEFAAYDHATYDPALLEVDYTAGGGGGGSATFLPAIAGLGW